MIDDFVICLYFEKKQSCLKNILKGKTANEWGVWEGPDLMRQEKIYYEQVISNMNTKFVTHIEELVIL